MTFESPGDSNWTSCKLGELARISKGMSYSSDEYTTKDDGVPFLTLNSVLKNGGFNWSGVKYYSGDYDESCTVKAGDLLIANTDVTRQGEVVGSPVIVPSIRSKAILFSMDLSKISIQKDVLTSRFLYYYLMTHYARTFMKSMASGSTVLHLDLKAALKLKVIFPELDEQERISRILGAVDTAIFNLSEVIAKTKKLLQILARKLLKLTISQTRKQGDDFLKDSIQQYLSKHKNRSIRNTPAFYLNKLGMPPRHFRIHSMNDLFYEVKRPIDMKDNTEYSLITVRRRNAGLVLREKLKGSEILVKNQHRVESGDFLISRRQIVHYASGIVPPELDGSLVSGEYFILRPNPERLHISYLEYLQRTKWFNLTCWFASQGVVVEKLVFKNDQWLRLPIPVPPLDEQVIVSRFLDSLERTRQSHDVLLNSTYQLKRALIQKLVPKVKSNR